MHRWRWGILVMLLALIMAFAISTRDPWARGAEGDGYYAWLFARSIVYDGDIEFKNDYAICGDRWTVGLDRGTGHPNNNFSFGQIVFWVPALEVARVLVPIPANAPPDVRASCVGPRVSAVLVISPILGALTVLLCYLVGRRWASDGAAALAAGLVAIAGTNLAYAGWMVSYSHIYASFAVALLFWASLRAGEKDTLRSWSFVGFAIALATFQRPTEIVFGLVPLTIAWRTRGAQKWPISRSAAVLGILGAGAVAGALPILLVYDYLFGGPFVIPQGRYYLFFAHAHPWLVLFAPRGGLFYSAPTAWLGVFGLVMALRDRRHRFVFAAMALASAVEIFIAASASDWHESWGFGARRLTTLTPMLVASASLFFERGRKWLARRPARARIALGLSWLLPATMLTFGLIDASAHNVIVPDYGHAQADYYGAGSKWVWGLMDEHVGDLAVLPAEIVFSWRYRLSPRSFRDATEPFSYGRMQRGDMHFTSNHLPFGDARMANLSRGFEAHEGMMRMTAQRGRFVFAAEWPFATAFDLELDVPEDTHLRVGIGHAFGVHWIGDVAVRAGVDRHARFAVPPGEFDSGINEVVLERTSSQPIDLRRFTILDETVYPPAM